jgi:2-polyprenyl-3-methyl-5-hydroxy-6-metoxy-1,4-benzoquinol methylase
VEDYKKITIDSYNKNVKDLTEYYKSLSDFNKRKEFSKFIVNLEGKKILDVGCAAGFQSAWFKTQGLDVTGIDLSEKMVEHAKKEGINAILMDMEEITFNENSFDGIWAIASLLHLKKDILPNVISSFSSILKKNGILMIGVKEGTGEEYRTDKQNPNTKRYFSYWKDQELLNLLGKKFSLIESWKLDSGEVTYLYFLLRNKK